MNRIPQKFSRKNSETSSNRSFDSLHEKSMENENFEDDDLEYVKSKKMLGDLSNSLINKRKMLTSWEQQQSRKNLCDIKDMIVDFGYYLGQMQKGLDRDGALVRQYLNNFKETQVTLFETLKDMFETFNNAIEDDNLEPAPTIEDLEECIEITNLAEDTTKLIMEIQKKIQENRDSIEIAQNKAKIIVEELEIATQALNSQSQESENISVPTPKKVESPPPPPKNKEIVKKRIVRKVPDYIIPKEKEKSDTRKWPRYIYYHDNSNYEHETGNVACVIRSDDKSFMQNNLICDVLDFPTIKDRICMLKKNYEIVSNAIRITPDNLESPFRIVSDPWPVCLPFSPVRGLHRDKDILILQHLNNTWKELKTNDIIVEEVKELGKFAETMISNFTDCLLMVISKPKSDHLQLTGKIGGQLSSSVDPRVEMHIPPEAILINISISLEIIQIDDNLFAKTKLTTPQNVADDIVAISPIVCIDSVEKSALEPITLILPVASLVSQRKKDRTKSARITSSDSIGTFDSKQRPQTSVGPKRAVQDYVTADFQEEVHVVVKYIGKPIKEWQNLKNAIISENNDQVSVKLDKIQPMEVALIRTKGNRIEDYIVPNLMSNIDWIMQQKTVNIVLRQNSNDFYDIIVAVSLTSRLDNLLDTLTLIGYGQGPNPSVSFEINERQCLHFKLQGNIIMENGLMEFDIIFNSQILNEHRFRVKEVDRYAQKDRDYWSGLVIFNQKQGHSNGPALTRAVTDVSATGVKSGISQDKSKMPVNTEDLTNLQFNFQINIPKREHNWHSTPIKARFEFQPTDAVNTSYLEKLAYEIGDDWNLLGTKLKISNERLHAIRQIHHRHDTKELAYDMLITWLKKQPAQRKPYKILLRALHDMGRGDLAEELHDRQTDFLLQRESYQD